MTPSPDDAPSPDEAGFIPGATEADYALAIVNLTKERDTLLIQIHDLWVKIAEERETSYY